MKQLIVFLFLITAHAFSSSYQNYFDLIEQYQLSLGPEGNHQLGEIEIILDEEKIIEIENRTGRQVGIIADDKYWIWINDAVQFPSGSQGVYSRIIWKTSLKGVAGVAILPLLPNGKIALNKNFRHATRSWEYELPRGIVEDHETATQAARREMREETGYVADEVHFLGHMCPDSGLTNTVVPVYLAKVSAQHEAQPNDSEAIETVEAFSIEEIKKMLLEGTIRDPFLIFALFQWELNSNFY